MTGSNETSGVGMGSHELKEIPKGRPGWKRRQQEILIINIMKRATTPNSSWTVWGKIKKIKSAPHMDGLRVGELMYDLAKNGSLEIVDSCVDDGYLYVLPRG